MTKTATSPGFLREGFTLMELLIVIVIMSILVTLLVPMINKILQNVDTANSKAFVQRVANAAGAFKGDNNGRYPGQDDIGQLKGTTPDAGPYTGSQIAAARLFDYPDSEIPSNAPNATSKYLEYKAHLLIRKDSTGAAIARNSLGDDSKTTNALLYFPSRLNVTAPTACYMWADNSAYVTTASAKARFENNCIKDPRIGTVARNAGGILIIGTGANDMYLETSENDDIKSWETTKTN
ncbi:MAG: prepilin-type N-terminal cleavage/methylation domain-containing protein [Phycisphaerae bacterium]|jgi:prepilin-type N-terminal cleavage/methylation domain-containing protein|nr:prepilin-type N-terminal cleavage/methylation domain-containing protein [Phycisphaerae bacterium]